MSRAATVLCLATVLVPSLAVANPFTLPFRMMGAGAKAMKQVGTSATRSMLKGDLLGAAGHMNPVNAAVVGYQHLTAPNANPHDPSSWAPSFHGGGVSQRGMVGEDGRLYMRTQVDVKQPSSGIGRRAEQAFRGSWKEFGYGGDYKRLSREEYTRRTGRVAAHDSVTYELDPPAGLSQAPGGLIRVNEQLRTRSTQNAMVGRLQLDGHVVGKAHVGVAPTGSDAVLEGGFDGVEIGGMAKLLGPGTMGLLHGAVEAQGFYKLGKKIK